MNIEENVSIQFQISKWI